MANYLVAKVNNVTTSYSLKDTSPSSGPYLRVSNGYLPLTTDTSKSGIKVKVNNQVYNIQDILTTTYTSSINVAYDSYNAVYDNTNLNNKKFYAEMENLYYGEVNLTGIYSSMVNSTTSGSYTYTTTINYRITQLSKTVQVPIASLINIIATSNTAYQKYTTISITNSYGNITYINKTHADNSFFFQPNASFSMRHIISEGFDRLSYGSIPYMTARSTIYTSVIRSFNSNDETMPIGADHGYGRGYVTLRSGTTSFYYNYNTTRTYTTYLTVSYNDLNKYGSLYYYFPCCSYKYNYQYSKNFSYPMSYGDNITGRYLSDNYLYDVSARLRVSRVNTTPTYGMSFYETYDNATTTLSNYIHRNIQTVKIDTSYSYFKSYTEYDDDSRISRTLFNSRTTQYYYNIATSTGFIHFTHNTPGYIYGTTKVTTGTILVPSVVSNGTSVYPYAYTGKISINTIYNKRYNTSSTTGGNFVWAGLTSQVTLTTTTTQ